MRDSPNFDQIPLLGLSYVTVGLLSPLAGLSARFPRIHQVFFPDRPTCDQARASLETMSRAPVKLEALEPLAQIGFEYPVRAACTFDYATRHLTVAVNGFALVALSSQGGTTATAALGTGLGLYLMLGFGGVFVLLAGPRLGELGARALFR